MKDTDHAVDTDAAPGLDDARRLLRDLPGADLAAATQAGLREGQLTKPAGALGHLEDLAAWMATWQGRHPPTLQRPRVAVFAGNHGVAERGVSAYPTAVTVQMVKNFVDGGAAVNQICTAMNADLRVYELALDTPTADFTTAPAMTEEDCGRALAYGMMAVEQGIDLLCLGEMGIGNTTAAAALSCALFGGAPEAWVGPGTGVAGSAYEAKVAAVAAGVARHRDAAADPFDMLRRLGGREMAAICGAVLAARMARVPVLLDGFVCTAAAMPVLAAEARGLDHCRVGQMSPEPGHRRLIERLGTRPILDLGMRLGEAAGAALAIGTVRAAVACHTGMATFADAGVSGPA